MLRIDRKVPAAVVRVWILCAASALAGAGETARAQSPLPSSGKTSGDATATCTAASNTGKPAQLPLTQAQGTAILEELRRIEILLSSRAPGDNSPAPAARSNSPVAETADVRIKLEPGWSALGSPDAPVIVLEFVDLQCPFCQQFHSSTFPRLKAEYIDAGKVRYISLDLPLPIHRYAREAAEAARCAGAQGKFWAFRDAILTGGSAPTPERVNQEARNLGLNLEAFALCQQRKTFAPDVRSNEENAAAVGIKGTPTFVIGRAVDGWLDGARLRGNRPYDAFQSAVEAALKSRPESGVPAGSK